MAELDVNAFINTLASETVFLEVGDAQSQQHIGIAKGLLCHKSHWFTKLLTKPGYLDATGNTVEVPGIGVAVVKLFVYWCYHERLPACPSTTNTNVNAKTAVSKQWKELLIDLWLFADTYGVPVLQNQVIASLGKLFSTGVDLTVDDVKYMYDRTSTPSSPLRNLAVFRAVAQVESPTNNTGRGIEDFKDSLHEHADFAVKAYEVVKKWMSLTMPQKNVKNKWALFLQQEAVSKHLQVSERMPELQTPLASTPIRGFAPGEVIKIDD